MGCKDAVLTEPLLKNCTINLITFEKNTGQPYNNKLCLFCALNLHLDRKQKLEEGTSKLFCFFMNRMDKVSPNQFQGVHMNDFPNVDVLPTLNTRLFDIDNVDQKIIGELARWRLQKQKNLWDYWNTTTIDATRKTLLVPSNFFFVLIVLNPSKEH